MDDNWIEEVIQKIEVAYGLRCRVCGAEMKHAASGPEGTYVACGSPEVDFISIGHSDRGAYTKAVDHYRESRNRINYDAQNAAKYIISIIKQTKRTD